MYCWVIFYISLKYLHKFILFIPSVDFDDIEISMSHRMASLVECIDEYQVIEETILSISDWSDR